MPIRGCLLAAFILFFAPAALAQTETVEPRPLVETLEIDGVFVPREAEAVAYEGEVYGGGLEVVRALDGGAIQKGTVLVQFDEEELRKQLLAAERDLMSAAKKHAIQMHEHENKVRQHELKLKQLETRVKRTEESMQRFLEIDKPQRIAQSAHSLEGQENRLQDQTEELEQLEKMYKEDDLTEETEEIVLRRTRRNLVRSRKSLEWQRRRHQKLLEITLPHDEENLRMEVEQRRLELATYRQTAPLRLQIGEIDRVKSETSLVEKKERVESLRGDLDRLRVRAPIDGFAVRGAFRDGKWHDLDGLRKALKPEGKVKARQTLYTIVHPGNVEFVASVPEARVLDLEVGRTAELAPGILGDKRLPAKLARIAPVAVGGKYRVVLRLQETDARLMPGQTAKATIVRRRVEDALTVPTSAVIRDRGKAYVEVQGEAKDAARRAVELGATVDGRVEILAGLESGEVIRVEPKTK